MDQFIQLEHVDLTDLKPLSVHHWGMTIRPADAPPPRPSDPVNGFGVVFAIGPLLFWLFGHNLRGHLYTSAGSDDAHVLIWPALGNQVLWPPRDTLQTEAELEQLARHTPSALPTQNHLG